MVTADQALAAACAGLAVLSVKQQQGDPEAGAQIEALNDAAALIARDIREESQ
ncbi:MULTISPECIES: hypothetical protein [Streptomyces]|uniref:hypothetical protein n=1 Tax=Streptomyces TaxID=1883 RepID=UPI000303CDAA|nr:hypothetical protein [Streptomyces venezuelae]